MREQEARIRDEARELLAFVGLSAQADMQADTLPYGQQRLLEVARALAAQAQAAAARRTRRRPRTPTRRTALADTILRIRDRGITVLLIEHDMSLVMQHRAAHRGARLRQEDRRRHACGDQGASGRDRGLPRKSGGRPCLISLCCIQSLISGIGVGLIYGLVGIGFCVIYNASGIVNFAQGVFVMLGGMIAHALLTHLGAADLSSQR